MIRKDFGVIYDTISYFQSSKTMSNYQNSKSNFPIRFSIQFCVKGNNKCIFLQILDAKVELIFIIFENWKEIQGINYF